MATYPLTIVSPDGVVFSGEVGEMNIRTTAGEITVLRKHEPIISGVEPDYTLILRGGEVGAERKISHGAGTLHVRPSGEVAVLIESASENAQ